MSGREWSIERLDGVELWTIDGEARRNALSRAMIRELLENLARVRDDRAVRCVVVTGKGRQGLLRRSGPQGAGHHVRRRGPPLPPVAARRLPGD